MLKLEWPGPAFPVSLHNHSDMSDGASSPEEICRAGKRAGVREFGLSDHWVEHPREGSDQDEWRLAPGRLDEYVERLLKLKAELDDDDFTLRLGLEVDFFFENADEVLAKLLRYPFDYLIGSVHYTGIFGVDHDRNDWLPLSPAEMEEVCRVYWEKLEGAAARSEFAFIGHLDLPKKFGFIDNTLYYPRAHKVLEILAAHGGAIEFNTAGWFKNCAEAYPAPALLREAAARRIPVVVSSDAHHPDHVTRAFDRGRVALREAGYPVEA